MKTATNEMHRPHDSSMAGSGKRLRHRLRISPLSRRLQRKIRANGRSDGFRKAVIELKISDFMIFCPSKNVHKLAVFIHNHPDLIDRLIPMKNEGELVILSLKITLFRLRIRGSDLHLMLLGRGRSVHGLYCPSRAKKGRPDLGGRNVSRRVHD